MNLIDVIHTRNSDGNIIVEIEVLNDDIRHGNKDDCHTCALARAIKRRVAPYFRPDVSVGSQSFSVGIASSQELPGECVEWIRRFDEGEKVEPFRFQINLPEYFITGKFD